MAKKDNDNFDFETEGQAKEKSSFDLAEFFKNLTKQQKGIILAAVVGIVVVIAVVVICILVGTNNTTNGEGTGDDGSSDVGDSGDENRGEVDLEAEPTQIYVATVPNKTVYYVGDTPNYSGLSIGVMEENSSGFKLDYDEYPEELIITGFDSSKPAAEQVITVQYKEYTTSFTVVIKAKSTGVELSSITVSIPKKEYKLGEALDYTGALLLCEYSDGSTKYLLLESEGVKVTGFVSITTPGTHDITVEYFDENGGYAKTTFTVTVTE